MQNTNKSSRPDTRRGEDRGEKKDYRPGTRFGERSFGPKKSFGTERQSYGGDRPSFDYKQSDRKPGGTSNLDTGRPDMFKAICADCGKNTAVPFKPTQNKPVYCRDCFRKRNDNDSSSGNDSRGYDDRRSNSEYKPRENSEKSETKVSNQSSDLARLTEQVNALHQKMDRIIKTLETM